MRRVCLLLLFFSTFQFSFSQEVRIHQINCKLEPDVLREVSEALYLQVNFYSQIFGDSTLGSFVAKVFGTKKEFVEYSRNRADYNPVKHNAIAFFSPRLKEMVLHLEVRNFKRTFKHELSHAIFEYHCKGHPSWLTEGLSELFEDIILVDKKYEFTQGYIRKYERAGEYLSEKQRVTDVLFTDSFYGKHMSKNYNLSWAVVAYLFSADKSILHNILRSACGDWSNLIEDHYPGGLTFLQSDLENHYLNYSPLAR